MRILDTWHIQKKSNYARHEFERQEKNNELKNNNDPVTWYKAKSLICYLQEVTGQHLDLLWPGGGEHHGLPVIRPRHVVLENILSWKNAAMHLGVGRIRFCLIRIRRLDIAPSSFHWIKAKLLTVHRSEVNKRKGTTCKITIWRVMLISNKKTENILGKEWKMGFRGKIKKRKGKEEKNRESSKIVHLNDSRQ